MLATNRVAGKRGTNKVQADIPRYGIKAMTQEVSGTGTSLVHFCGWVHRIEDHDASAPHQRSCAHQSAVGSRARRIPSHFGDHLPSLGKTDTPLEQSAKSCGCGSPPARGKFVSPPCFSSGFRSKGAGWLQEQRIPGRKMTCV